MRILAGLLLTITPAFSQSVSPFTVIEVSRRFDAAGKLKSESRFLFAMDRDGSIVSVDLDPKAGRTRQIIDRKKHRTVLINPNSRWAAISGYSPPVIGSPDACEQRFRFFKDAIVSVDESAGAIQGVAVQRVSISMPDGTTMQVFVAPSLRCHMLRTLTSRNGVLSQTQTSEGLRIGDPDPLLFTVPPNYRFIR